ncbi:MAG: hypothetical protein ACRECO_06225 [Xanthobacteraceae bacterium]
MFKRVGATFTLIVFTLIVFTLIVAAVAPAPGIEPFPLAGTYTRDAPCKGSGSDRPDLLVTIGKEQIESSLGVCKIVNWKRDGKAIRAHMECRMAGDQVLLGEATFTVRDDTTIEFEDQDHTSDATLYKCTG